MGLRAALRWSFDLCKRLFTSMSSVDAITFDRQQREAISGKWTDYTSPPFARWCWGGGGREARRGLLLNRGRPLLTESFFVAFFLFSNLLLRITNCSLVRVPSASFVVWFLFGSQFEGETRVQFFRCLYSNSINRTLLLRVKIRHGKIVAERDRCCTNRPRLLHQQRYSSSFCLWLFLLSSFQSLLSYLRTRKHMLEKKGFIWIEKWCCLEQFSEIPWVAFFEKP